MKAGALVFSTFIKSQGYLVETQVGCSGFRIDIGVKRREQPGRFVLGIECDGATYHSAPTVRDRDRLRQEVLENLGWRIHRVWGPDWVRQRRREEDRLRLALQQASVEPASLPERTKDEAQTPIVSVVVTPPVSGNEAAAWPPKFARVFRAATPKVPSRLLGVDPSKVSLAELGSILGDLAIQENGILIERALNLAKQAWHIQRLADQLRIRMLQACTWLPPGLEKKDGFLLPVPYQPRVQVPASPENPEREFAEVPPGEVAFAIKHLLNGSGLVAEDELARQVIKLYGRRAAATARSHFDGVLKEGAAAGSWHRSSAGRYGKDWPGSLLPRPA